MIPRVIFQGDALSPLLFVIAMMPLNHIGNALEDTNSVIARSTTGRYQTAKNEKEL